MHAIAATADIVAALRSQAPAFAARAADAERDRSAPAATVAAVSALGAHRLLQPAGFGGAERGVRDHCEVVAAVSEGCVATGWCVAVWSAHNWMLAQLDPRGQADVWAEPGVRITASIVPRTRFAATAEGVQVQGRFPFGSGADHAGGFGVGGMVEIDGAAEQVIAALPASAVQVDHASWQVMGLRGTGSKDLLVPEPVLVPWHRVLRIAQVGRRTAPGQQAPAASLYRAPFRAVSALVLAPPALGAARAALARFIERLDGHALPLTGLASQRQDPAARLRIAEASAEIDAAELVLLRAADDCDALGRQGVHDPLAEARVLRDTAWSVRLCARAVDRLFEAAGGSSLSDAEPLQRLWRDVMAARSHVVLTWDAAAHAYAHARLGA
jgi:3-hydroxy-9,10-secoandrosta-1,3,5(10)-triene-9,17-dione monooxygenase